MQKTDQDLVQDLAAEYAETKQVTAAQVARRRAIVEQMLTLRNRAAVAELIGVKPQRVSEIVGGVRES